MSIPQELVEWSVWENLDKINETELLLLKGHVIMDLILSGVITEKNSSFHGKASQLGRFSEMKLASEYLLKLTKIRNVIAHEFTSDVTREKIFQWSKGVLKDFDCNLFTKLTKRTTIVHSFSALAVHVYKFGLKQTI